mmetsp:Transcript_99376/g.286793  ORF Transcript_99376/g.286793 Transcript_99376/m.286793 type:complete len:202 (+) Transcript_99376:846-1451(+)
MKPRPPGPQLHRVTTPHMQAPQPHPAARSAESSSRSNSSEASSDREQPSSRRICRRRQSFPDGRTSGTCPTPAPTRGTSQISPWAIFDRRRRPLVGACPCRITRRPCKEAPAPSPAAWWALWETYFRMSKATAASSPTRMPRPPTGLAHDQVLPEGLGRPPWRRPLRHRPCRTQSRTRVRALLRSRPPEPRSGSRLLPLPS